MNLWIAKGVVIAATVVMIAIRAPHGQRSRSVAVASSRKGLLERMLLTIAWVSFFVPIVWIASPWLDFANYELRPAPLAAGIAGLAAGLYVFHRSHVDLGTNWSITLEIRATHTLVTDGVYRYVRHPMYAGLILYAIGQALVLPNRIAGPSYFVAMVLLFVFRLGPEESMMRARFPAEWEAYAARTKRLVPGIW